MISRAFTTVLAHTISGIAFSHKCILSLSLSPPLTLTYRHVRCLKHTESRTLSHKRNNKLFLPLSIMHTSALASRYNTRTHSLSLSVARA